LQEQTWTQHVHNRLTSMGRKKNIALEFTAGSKLLISLRSYTVEEEAEPLQELNILHIIAGLNKKGSHVCHIIAGLNKKGSHVSHIITGLNKI
jgi:hypothetical protein